MGPKTKTKNINRYIESNTVWQARGNPSGRPIQKNEHERQ
nr:MAG TPA: hypothetical protein [Caudoviricetes sp.]